MLKVCTNCIMDTTDKDITFIEGVCNHCREYPAREKQRKLDRVKLPWIIHEIKKKGCLLGLSGGVDSSTCLHYLLEQGVKPMCFSMDNDTNTPEAEHNVKNLVEKTGVIYSNEPLDFKKFKELRQAFLSSGVPNVEIPTDHCLMAITYSLASAYGVKYIISGGNLATESVMPASWGWNARDLTHIKDIYRRFTGKKLTGLPTISLWQYIYYRFIKGIKIINLLDFYEYNRKEAIELLTEKYDYKDYGEKHGESTFTKWFQNWFLPRRFGVDKRKPHLSSLILSGQMTRDEALNELAQPLEYPKMEFLMGNPKKHTDFKTGEWQWKLASLIYRKLK